MEKIYYHNDSINNDRDNYFRYFAQKLFGWKFWGQVQDQEEQASIFLLAFHTLISQLCSLDKDNSLIIVYNSLLGKRLLFNPKFEDFKDYFERANFKYGKISIIPFFNRSVKGNFEAFEDLYQMYETKMFNDGDIDKKGNVIFTYHDKEFLKFDSPLKLED